MKCFTCFKSSHQNDLENAEEEKSRCENYETMKMEICFHGPFVEII
jgi:hypothetical protein